MCSCLGLRLLRKYNEQDSKGGLEAGWELGSSWLAGPGARNVLTVSFKDQAYEHRQLSKPPAAARPNKCVCVCVLLLVFVAAAETRVAKKTPQL